MGVCLWPLPGKLARNVRPVVGPAGVAALMHLCHRRILLQAVIHHHVLCFEGGPPC